MYTTYLLIAAVSTIGFFHRGFPFSWITVVYIASWVISVIGAHIVETRRAEKLAWLGSVITQLTYAKIEDADGKPIAPGHLFVTIKETEDEQ